MRVYLAGPINGCDDVTARGWREEAKRLLTGHEVLDPMVRDYRGVEDHNVKEIVEGDLADIASCDVVIVNALTASWGTAIEVRAAKAEMGKRVIAFPNGRVSPWLRYHAEIASCIYGACSLATDSPSQREAPISEPTETLSGKDSRKTDFRGSPQ